MRKCILLDFDGTITVRDTTRYLVFELLRLRPLLSLRLIPKIARYYFTNNDIDSQNIKNALIGFLIKGLSPSEVHPAIVRYRKKVVTLFRPLLIKLIRTHASNHAIILVVTASPDFAVKEVLRNESVEVIGTTFTLVNRQYTGNVFGLGCYGSDKLALIKEWQRKSHYEIHFDEAWTDAESDLSMMQLAENHYWLCPPLLPGRINEIDPFGNIVNV